MQPISRRELNEQATAYAYDMVAFLADQNARDPNPDGAFRHPQDATERFAHLYMQFVARWRLVLP
jgi:hypothetical protein